MSKELTSISFTPRPEAPKLDDAQRVADYLRGGSILVIAVGKDDDLIDSSAGRVVPIGAATDGDYTWPLSLTYYVEQYGLSFDNRLLSEIRRRRYRCPIISSSTVQELRKTSASTRLAADPESPPRTDKKAHNPFG